MAQLSYRRHRFPASIVQHSIWLYLRFTLSYRDVKDLLAERGLDISYETVRRWVLKFAPSIARTLRQRQLRPSPGAPRQARASFSSRGWGLSPQDKVLDLQGRVRCRGCGARAGLPSRSSVDGAHLGATMVQFGGGSTRV